MENKKMDWSKPLLVELEKATYTVGSCSTGPQDVGENCSTGKSDYRGGCFPGGSASIQCKTGLGGAQILI